MAENTSKEIEIRKMLVTPSIALDWLKASSGNRKESNQKISEYADMMKNGLWGFCNDMIVFDDEGVLRNGHHRLYAVVKSGMSIEFFVAFNAPKDSWQNFDQGKIRGVGAMLEVQYGTKIKNTNTLAAIGRIMLGYEKYKSDFLSFSQCVALSSVIDRLNQKDVFSYTHKHFDEIQEAFTFARHGRTQRTYTTVLACFIIIARHNKCDEAKLEDFVNKIITLENLEPFSPILACYRKISTAPLHTLGYKSKCLMLLIKTWNYFVNNRKAASIQYPSGMVDIIKA